MTHIPIFSVAALLLVREPALHRIAQLHTYYRVQQLENSESFSFFLRKFALLQCLTFTQMVLTDKVYNSP